jgi:hypothetical protein
MSALVNLNINIVYLEEVLKMSGAKAYYFPSIVLMGEGAILQNCSSLIIFLHL